MMSAIIQFVAASLVIIVAGAALTRFADAIAERTGIGRLLVGSILLAGATSLPELSVDINAVRLGMPDLAVGDLVGSCLFNLLILAGLDLTHRSRGTMLSRTAAAHALSGTVSIALVALAGIFILVSHRWPEFMLGGVGIGCIVILIAYILSVRLVYCDQRLSPTPSESRGNEVATHVGQPTLRKAILGFVISATVIVVTAPYMAEAAGRLAELSGLGGTFIGSTLVAFCTSLPELVATITALRMGAFDLAIGNVFGSNAFNMVLLLPLDFVAPGSLLANVSETHVVTCFCTVLITAVALMGQLYHAERRIRFLEPDALLVILLVLGALGLIYLLR